MKNFTRGENFLSHDSHALLGIIPQCGSPYCTLQKRHFLLFSLAKKRIYLDTQLKEVFADLF